MILLDTHVWLWFVDDSDRLTKKHRQLIAERQKDGLGVSVISCWEVAKLTEYGRLKLACAVEDWMEGALSLPGIRLIDLTPTVAIASTKLPVPFHRDPADQIIVATAQAYDLDLLTMDDKILKYPHVKAH